MSRTAVTAVGLLVLLGSLIPAGSASAHTLPVKKARYVATHAIASPADRSAGRTPRVYTCHRIGSHGVACLARKHVDGQPVCKRVKVQSRTHFTRSTRHNTRRVACPSEANGGQISPSSSGERDDDDQPPPASRPLYGEGSPWNQRIADHAKVDGRSSAMVDQLNQEVNDKGWPIATGAWTNSIYYADSRTPRQDVKLTGAYSGRRLGNVPIPEDARVPSDSDGGMIVIDREGGCEYDFARAQRDSNGNWSAWHANAHPTDGSGVYPFAEAPSASGFASAGGTILPEDMQAGQIDHALAFTMHHTKAGGPVAPATASDGWSGVNGAIPEGARLQLDPDLDLDRLGLTSWEKTIARALQDYGMYLVDTGGAVALRAQHSMSTSFDYPWGNGDYGQVPESLARHLRVLELGPQQPVTYRFVENRCASLVR